MKRTTLVLGLVMLAACDGDMTPPFVEPTLTLDAQLRQSIGTWGPVPIGEMPQLNAAQVALGRALFFDKILSGNKDMACASCHQPQAALSDGLALAVGTGATGAGTARVPGAGRSFGARQSPTLLNSGLGMFYLFWDGRLTRFGQEFPGQPLPIQTSPNGAPQTSLINQAMLTVLNRLEMRGVPGDVDVAGSKNELAMIADDQHQAVWQGLMQRLLAIPEYVQMFSAAYPGRTPGTLRFEDAANAIAVFQMQAFTRTNSPFDRYLKRDDNALSTEQKRGGLLFFGRAQCGSCHSGPFLGGQNFTNVGVPQIGPGGAKQSPLDWGRGELMPQNPGFFKFAFRVAPLRNVELTAPYMHNGAYQTLEAVVEHYNNVQKALREYDASQLPQSVRSYYHGEQATIDAVWGTVDFRLRTPLNLTDTEKAELVAFLKSLTDPAARDLSGIAPARVPSGLPLN